MTYKLNKNLKNTFTLFLHTDSICIKMYVVILFYNCNAHLYTVIRFECVLGQTKHDCVMSLTTVMILGF